MLDLSRCSAEYPEAPWKLVVQADHQLENWPFEPAFVWPLIPVETPFWRKPPTDASLADLSKLLETPGHPHLGQDPSLPVWAELHPRWMNHEVIQRLWQKWLVPHHAPRAQDATLWVKLHWMQPALKLNAVFAALNPAAVAVAIFHMLWCPVPLVVPTSERQRVLVADLTLVQPDLAMFVWPFFRNTDPFSLAQADALYLAGRPQQAIECLDQDLPDDPRVREQVRLRLIEWLAPEDSVPHRIALAWESGSLSYAEPIRHLMSDAEWTQLMRALRVRRASEPSADDPA
jgi:hypothetical protein